MRVFGQLFFVGVALTSAACAGSSATGGASGPTTPAATSAAAPNEAGAHTANLAGRRCHGALCACRGPSDAAEAAPPDEAHKRFEIRLGAVGGPATLSSPTLGQLASGARDEACFYIDVVPGTTHDVTFVARERRPEEGVSPELRIAEYGPKGPWWYDVLDVKCDGPGGHCNREAADAWSAELKTRKRGRIDPCGSAVIKNLKWDTSGGTGVRELGLFADFKVTFTLEVKKFATQFAPGSTECVPK